MDESNSSAEKKKTCGTKCSLIARVAIGMVAVIGALAAYLAMQSPEFVVSRSAIIGTPPVAVFPYINDVHKFQLWNPWSKLDPNCKISYEGPAEGVGAKFSWAGNADVGKGSMTCVGSTANQEVRYRLDFVEPFAGTNADVFSLAPEGGKTKITWTMSGERTIICRVMSLFMSMDKMCGDQFEKGLVQLKSITEAESAKPLKTSSKD